MKQKSSISAPVQGMQRDVNPNQLPNTAYPLAVNVTTQSEDGSGYSVQLEPSNYLGVVFPFGYKILGFKNDHIRQRTYYFLTNTVETDENSVDYKRSSVGYVDVSTVLDNDFNNTQSDTQCNNCNELDTPLEDIVQTPSLQYVELLHDRCISLANLEEQGFNFDIRFPIKKIEINQEKLGTTLYWNDFRNPPRYLNVTEVEANGAESYVFEVLEPCEDPTYQECVNIDRLRLFPKHNRIVLEPSEQQTGGNLKMGTYEFWASYCDLMGNEMTQYSTPTNPISIWDENNAIQGQTETDEFTNYSIKIKVNNLDTENFRYYKVAVVERNNISNTQSVFLAGIYPTTDDTIVYTHSGSSNDDLYIARGNVSVKKRMDFQTLNAVKPEWERAKGTMVSGDTLFHYGLVQKEEMNLQPVLNLFGSLLHAQTSAASENLYKSAIATSKYKFYPRNEVIPFGIRILYTDGGYSATFPLIARPALDGEKDTVDDMDKNYNSLLNNTSCVTSTRNQKWQIFNTAVAYNDLCTDIEEGATETEVTLTQYCTKEGVVTIPAGELLIEPDAEYYGLEDYLNSNPSAIPAVEDALEATYEEGCDSPPVFYGDCDTATVVGTSNLVGEINGEETENTYKETSAEYTKALPPDSAVCIPYKRNISDGSYIADTAMTPYMDCGSVVYKRDSDFFNEDCAYASDVINITNPLQNNGSSIFLNYAGADTEAELLQDDYDVEPTTITGDFKGKLHLKAQFFRIERNSRNDIVFEITKSSECTSLDGLPSVSQVRYTIYDSCTGTPTVLGGGIVDLTTGVLEVIDISTFPNTFFVALDSPLREETVDLSCPPVEPDVVTVYRISPPCGCFGIYTRDLEIKNIKITYSSIRIDKRQTYQADCIFRIPRVNDCDPIPYRKYQTAYWESTENYDDNKELWDSSNLLISPSDIAGLSEKDTEEFLDYYVVGGSASPQTTGGFYILKDANFRCSPIRHFKMPDNTTAPYIIDSLSFQNNADSIIFPLGVEIDSAVVRTAITVAYNNGLITKKQRDSIQGFEIMRGDNSISKSVIANGIAFDMYKYIKEGDDIYFANFPFNDLGRNKYLTQTKFGTDNLSHPFGGDENYMYSFLSPDLLLHKPALPSEASLQGYVAGASKQQFVSSDEHSEWTILGGKARRTAEQLAIAEVALEFLTNVANFTTQSGSGNLWFIAGVAGGTNAAGAGISAAAIAVYLTAQAIQGITQVGKYRYDWLKVFRDLGRTYNFASMQVGAGDYNKMIKVEQYSDNYLRKLTVKKYLTDDYLTVVDENSGEEIKINNKVRETSAFFSFGEDYSLEFDNEYKTIDNNSLNSLSSNFVASEVDCVENKEFSRNVASPYFSLKNYIPDQHGSIDSIKWLTTNYIFDKDANTACTTIFGGTHVISRFSWRRKVPIFRKNAINHPDKQPFMYSRNDNIGYPRYYCDYELTDGDNMWQGAGIPYPDIDSEYSFDCETGRASMYVKTPSKIYTSVHGIVDFLVESEINCNFRYAGKEKKDWFYPQAQDLGNWLQEATLPISEPNSFFYNNTYTFPVSNSTYKVLDKTYSKELWMKRLQQPNALTWSQKEVNENDLTNPWNVYKPLDWYEFKTNNGKLIDLHNIESNQFLARFENKLMLHNAIDNIAERITPENRNLGVAGMFMQRPMEFKSTDLGFAGTQNTEIVSTPYGHFWCDAKRGKVFKVDQNGQGMEIISEVINGKPSGMKNWFREHLPFKILKYLPDVDIDNKFNGLGLNMWWDDRFERLFITKRDYIPASRCQDLSCTTSNLVVNGDFQDGLNGWDNQGDGIVVQNNKLWFSDSNDIEPIITQDILEVGKTYKITFDLYMNPSCKLEEAIIQWIRVYAGENTTPQITRFGNSRFETQLTCTGNTIFGIQMRYFCPYDPENLNTISVDNVCVVDVEDINRPELGDPDCILETDCIEYTEEGFVYTCDGQNTPITLRDEEYFQDVSWTIAYKPSEGTWNSYFTFYPDFSPYFNNFFQVGYNWGNYKETVWNHLLNRSSFCVFQGEKNTPIIEFNIANENVNKMLNSISLNLEGRYYVNDWDFSVNKDKSFKNMFIYNSTNNSGMLELVPQKMLSDVRKYPITENNNLQKILFTADEGNQNLNYFYNRMQNQQKVIPMFTTDKNNIFKVINPEAVNFKGKRVLERLRGNYFTVHLEGLSDSRFNLIFSNSINNETIDN